VKRKWESRLAVSTVIANMLMILITLSLAAILVAWAGTSYGTFTGGSQIFFVQRGQALQERFVIEEVFFNSAVTPHKMVIFIRNVGVEQVSLVAIYVDGNLYTPATYVPSGYCTTNADGSVMLVVGSGNANNVCEFSIGLGWSSGQVFSIVAASARGNQVSFTARGP
jgi:hypothetical protein